MTIRIRRTQRVGLQNCCSTVGILLGKIDPVLSRWKDEIHLRFEKWALSPRKGENFFRTFIENFLKLWMFVMK